ncbi:hypothetical protein D8674_009526 [Pyrus ussuriensis x Pyrus communis]|uniref:Uncharacterized protein n=1 Tax=Pyrus ussuriensis x Pyrus communis TaxID=2448454 RepID=A0A5N5F885_9ROSA|nr:hypothetical protein D8674_009526 [Pyrus ussuriensis x Pyrus communis]
MRYLVRGPLSVNNLPLRLILQDPSFLHTLVRKSINDQKSITFKFQQWELGTAAAVQKQQLPLLPKFVPAAGRIPVTLVDKAAKNSPLSLRNTNPILFLE